MQSVPVLVVVLQDALHLFVAIVRQSLILSDPIEALVGEMTQLLIAVVEELYFGIDINVSCAQALL